MNSQLSNQEQLLADMVKSLPPEKKAIVIGHATADDHIVKKPAATSKQVIELIIHTTPGCRLPLSRSKPDDDDDDACPPLVLESKNVDDADATEQQVIHVRNMPTKINDVDGIITVNSSEVASANKGSKRPFCSKKDDSLSESASDRTLHLAKKSKKVSGLVNPSSSKLPEAKKTGSSANADAAPYTSSVKPLPPPPPSVGGDFDGRLSMPTESKDKTTEKSINEAIKVPCQYCNKPIAAGYLPRHKNRCSKNPSVPDQEWICCGLKSKKRPFYVDFENKESEFMRHLYPGGNPSADCVKYWRNPDNLKFAPGSKKKILATRPCRH